MDREILIISAEENARLNRLLDNQAPGNTLYGSLLELVLSFNHHHYFGQPILLGFDRKTYRDNQPKGIVAKYNPEKTTDVEVELAINEFLDSLKNAGIIDESISIAALLA